MHGHSALSTTDCSYWPEPTESDWSWQESDNGGQMWAWALAWPFVTVSPSMSTLLDKRRTEVRRSCWWTDQPLWRRQPTCCEPVGPVACMLIKIYWCPGGGDAPARCDQTCCLVFGQCSSGEEVWWIHSFLSRPWAGFISFTSYRCVPECGW